MSEHTIVKVKDIMTKKLVTLNPEDSIEKATKLFEEYKYDGFPVVNEDGHLLGIVTAYDMVSQSYATHLPSLLHIIEEVYQKDHEGADILRAHFEKVRTVKVRDMMNLDPLIIGPEVKVEELAKEFLEHHRVNPIPVIDAEKKLLGVVSRFDIVRFFDQEYFNQMMVEAGHEGVLQRLGRFNGK